MDISEGEHFMKKTKIICTLGPATDKKDLLVVIAPPLFQIIDLFSPKLIRLFTILPS